jgi:capsular exopolysaccharide synthesis family protein
LAELDRSIAREETRIRASATNGFGEARSREADLQRRVNTLKGAMLDEQRSSIQYSIHQRDVDTNRELYEALLQRYKEIGVAGVQSSNVAVVDRAKLPEIPSSPNLPLNLMLGMVCGMALAGGYVFAREQLDQSLRDPSMAFEVLGLPLLGAIPNKTVDELAGEIADPKSDVSEAYLAAASNLSFLTTSGAPGSMLITSSRASEGKSTTARALATSLTRIGKRVLLIDADMRKPSQHKFFGVDNGQGLSHLLSGHIEPSAIGGLLRETGTDRLMLLTAGPVPPDPGVLLNNGRLPNFVNLLKGQFDHVIIDAPPVLGLADAPLLATVADGVIYVIEMGGVHMRVIRASLRRLQFSGARLFGAIVSKVVVNSSSYGYGEMYGYGYGADRGR